MSDQERKPWDDIHPDILAVDCEEFIASGWGGTPRALIPENWRDLSPTLRKYSGGRPRIYASQAEYRAARKAAK